MVVAGDHANNDMAGDDEDSWKSHVRGIRSISTALTARSKVLEESTAVEQLYVAHTQAAIDSIAK